MEKIAQGDPAKFTLKILHGDRLVRLVEKARERHYFEMSWPVTENDTAEGPELP